MALKLAIVGRPNVGKSTLFNRLAGKKLAIVDDRPGVTRDRRFASGSLGDMNLSLVDTAGFEDVDDDTLEARMRRQTELAIDEADVCLFLIDAREGVTPLDQVFAEILRRRDKPVLIGANKAEGKQGEPGIAEAWTLGFGEPIPISGEHGEGMADLYAALDSISVEWEWEDKKIRLVDTAGLRRKARIHEKLEQLSVADSIRTIVYAEVVLLVMDATHPFEVQDLQLADLVEREGRALVFVLAKWDLVEDQAETLKTFKEHAERMLPQVRGAPVVALSAETGFNLDKLMPAVVRTHNNWSTKVKTRDLNDWLQLAMQRHAPPSVNGKRIKPKYMAQTKARPPTFVLFSSRADQMPEQYRRYLVNSLRESFDLPGVPIRITIKSGANPYADADGDKRPMGSGTKRGPREKPKKLGVSENAKEAKQLRVKKAGKAKRMAKEAATDAAVAKPVIRSRTQKPGRAK
ncbi:MAG: ribosome-associated GTPase EngA [Caulobacteraceae bacterium]|nr:MAG: ribosome-associated GTPase EngA [Caulobacteraceae bacterium]